MAINVDILKIAPSSLVDSEMWNALLLAVQQQLMMVGRKAGLKDLLYKFDPTTLPYTPDDPMYTTYPTTTSYSQDMQYWIDYLVEFCKSFGYDPNLEMVTDSWTKEEIVKLLYQEAQSIWYKATHKGTKNFYDYVFKLYALLGGVYTILRADNSFYRYLQWDDVTRYVDSNSDSTETYVEEGILTKIASYVYGTPFTGIVPEKDASTIFTRSLNFDSDWEFDADASWYFDQYTDILPTTHMAFDYICDRIWNEVDEDGLVTKMLTPKRLLSYLRKAIDYGRKCTVVPHIGTQLNIVTPENLFFDAYSSGYSIPALELNTSITDNFANYTSPTSLDYTDAADDDFMDLSGSDLRRTDGDVQTGQTAKSSDKIYQYLAIGTGRKSLFSVNYPEILTNAIFYIPTDRKTPLDLVDSANTITVHGTTDLLFSKEDDNFTLTGWSGKALYFSDGSYLSTSSVSRGNKALTIYGWIDGAWALQASAATILSWAGISVSLTNSGGVRKLIFTTGYATPYEYTFGTDERPSGLFWIEIVDNDTLDFTGSCTINDNIIPDPFAGGFGGIGDSVVTINNNTASPLGEDALVGKLLYDNFNSHIYVISASDAVAPGNDFNISISTPLLALMDDQGFDVREPLDVVKVTSSPRDITLDELVGQYISVDGVLYEITSNTAALTGAVLYVTVSGTPNVASVTYAVYTSHPYTLNYYWNNTLLNVGGTNLMIDDVSGTGVISINNATDTFIGFIDEIHAYSKTLDSMTRDYIYNNRLGNLYTLGNEIYRTAISQALIREEDDFVYVGIEIPAFSVSNEAFESLGDGTTKVFTHTCVRKPVLPGYTHIYFTATVGGTLYNFELKDFGTPGYLYQVAFDDPTNPNPAFLLPIRSEGNINYETGEIILHTYFTHLLANQTAALTINDDAADGTINTLYNPAKDYQVFDLDISPVVVECELENTTALVTFNTTSYPSCIAPASIAAASCTFNTATGVIHIETTGYPIISAKLKQFAGELWAPPDNGTSIDVEYKTDTADLQITEAAIVGENDTNTVYASFPPVMFSNINDHLLVNFIVKKESVAALMSEVII